MAFSTRSRPLDSISEVKLEAMQTADELYYMEVKILDQNTELFVEYDLNLVENLIFTITNKVSSAILYITDATNTETTAVANETGGNITITDPEGGLFTVEIPNVHSDMPLGYHPYDVFAITNAGSKRKPILRGVILVVDNSTP